MIADDYNVAETMTRHRSRYRGSRPFAVIQAGGGTGLGVRVACAPAD
jgi:hypothetical protein